MTDDEINKLMRLGRAICSARKMRGLTQGELGEKVNISQNHLSNMEWGQRGISILDLIRISEVLDVPMSFFLDEITGQKFPPGLLDKL